MQTNKRNILIGISGSIAAYKIYELIRKLKKKNFLVKVVLTENAAHFVSQLTLETLTENKVYVHQFDKKDYNIEHISLVKWADLFIIAPATANVISKIAGGIGDDLLSTTAITAAARIPVLIAPAMNHFMFHNPIFQKNLNFLKTHDFIIISPETGQLACGDEGDGKLADVEKIELVIEKYLFEPLFSGKKILITAGSSVEKIDPVRYISNFSSGKMGYFLAKTAYLMGAETTVILGQSDVDFSSLPVNVVRVQSAVEMSEAFFQYFENMDFVIASAAVADYRPKSYQKNKIKKNNQELTLELEKNPDILEEAGKAKAGQVLVGFSLETDHEFDYATKKLEKKNLNYIVLNNPLKEGSELGGDTNQITIISRHLQEQFSFPTQSKKKCASEIFKILYQYEIQKNIDKTR